MCTFFDSILLWIWAVDLHILVHMISHCNKSPWSDLNIIYANVEIVSDDISILEFYLVNYT